MQHRQALAVPFALIVVVALIGGLANSMDVRGRVTDEITGEPKKDARIIHGSREVVSDENGEFLFTGLPRTSKVDVRPPRGYLLMTVLTVNAHDIKLHPLSVTIYAFDEAKTLDTGPVPNPQARDTANTKIIATGNESGQITVAPHPETEEGGRVSRLLICGEGFEPKEVDVHGVLMEVGLKAGGSGCPPLPTPTPDPNATPTPTPSPTAQPSPAPTPTPTPSPTGSP